MVPHILVLYFAHHYFRESADLLRALTSKTGYCTTFEFNMWKITTCIFSIVICKEALDVKTTRMCV